MKPKLLWVVAGLLALGGCGKRGDRDKPEPKPASSPTSYFEVDVGDIAPGVLYVCQGSASWCTVDVDRGTATVLNQVTGLGSLEPALWRPGNILVFAVSYPMGGRLVGTVDGTRFELEAANGARISHPTISRDGKLLAYRIALRRPGSPAGPEWTGNGEVAIVGVDLPSGTQRLVYFREPAIDNRPPRGQPMGPVFSPTEDLLVYADRSALHVVEAGSGKQLRTLPVPEIAAPERSGKAWVSSPTGLAFRPDGRQVVYLSAGEDEVDVNPDLIVAVDIDSGAASQHPIPRGYSAWSIGTIGVDFSPDGRYLVFSAVTMNQDNQLDGPFLMLADLDGGDFSVVESAGEAIHPLWKGR